MIDLEKGPFIENTYLTSHYLSRSLDLLVIFVLVGLSFFQVFLRSLQLKVVYVLGSVNGEYQLGIYTSTFFKQASRLRLRLFRANKSLVSSVKPNNTSIIARSLEKASIQGNVIFSHFDNTAVFFNITLWGSVMCWFLPSHDTCDQGCANQFNSLFT